MRRLAKFLGVLWVFAACGDDDAPFGAVAGAGSGPAPGGSSAQGGAGRAGAPGITQTGGATLAMGGAVSSGGKSDGGRDVGEAGAGGSSPRPAAGAGGEGAAGASGSPGTGGSLPVGGTSGTAGVTQGTSGSDRGGEAGSAGEGGASGGGAGGEAGGSEGGAAGFAGGPTCVPGEPIACESDTLVRLCGAEEDETQACSYRCVSDGLAPGGCSGEPGSCACGEAIDVECWRGVTALCLCLDPENPCTADDFEAGYEDCASGEFPSYACYRDYLIYDDNQAIVSADCEAAQTECSLE